MPQDPAVIQRQIEETRAELAETIDAIAEIVSPKRVAERANEQIRAKVTELRQRFAPNGAPALGGPDAERRAIEGRAIEGPGSGGTPAPVGSPGGAALTPGTAESVQVMRTVRWDRVALASAALVLVVGARRRRRRRRAG